MARRWIATTVVTVCLGSVLWCLTPRAASAGGHQKKASRSALPRVVATVTTITTRGMATITTADGATYEVLKGTSWRIGDPVSCERSDRFGLATWQALDCRKDA